MFRFARFENKMKHQRVALGAAALLLLIWWAWYVAQPKYEEKERSIAENETLKANRAVKEWRRACVGTRPNARQYKETNTVVECFREASYLFGEKVRFDTSSGLPLLTFGEQECSGEAAESSWHVLVVCGQHARELVTSEVCLDLLYELLFAGEDGVVWHIMPVLNPEGRIKVEQNPSKNGCWRGNAGGVDLNRNFPSWVDKKRRERIRTQIERNLPETEPGQYPGSERETRAVMEVLTREGMRVDMIVNVHSGTAAVGLPYDCCAQERHPLYHQMVAAAQAAKRPMYEDPGEVDPEDRERLRSWLEKLPVGQSSHSTILYESVGSLVDYAVGVARVPVGYTVEVYGVDEPVARMIAGEEATEGDVCFAQFNPSSGEGLDRVLRVWSRYLCDLGYAWKQIARKQTIKKT